MKSLLLREIPLQHGAFADGRGASKQYRTRSAPRATINEEQDVVIIGAGMLSLKSAILGQSLNREQLFWQAQNSDLYNITQV